MPSRQHGSLGEDNDLDTSPAQVLKHIVQWIRCLANGRIWIGRGTEQDAGTGFQLADFLKEHLLDAVEDNRRLPSEI